ncbi:RNA polymerase-binding protein DksA [Acinetobacter populi]|uniref:RNA polymerase-binding transcription factor DksA n=1 Tax=Acinetobacter populi TaxID=1582270 RepID=A0A1Z9Z016_9GAMM|nr:RNA polymerase-binding protein DksA [Acinetobacter populi]MCH4248436.1 RNA polymerase-binding protein DksA [Acinetobacter populi]OUY07794.1 RNA polymerase-binding protein DksA [Acinetobacter populi]
MANQNETPIDDVKDVATTEKPAVKRTRKPKTKTEMGTTASLFGFAPYQEKKNEEYMSEGQLEHFRKILEAWKAELMSEVDRTLTSMQDESSALPDVNDRATQEEEFAIELRTRDRERKLIRKIEQSLQAIKDEDYGYCETCGIEIGLRRLEARPTATLCIDCKTLAEIKEKQNNG